MLAELEAPAPVVVHREVCAWCQAVLVEGTPDAPVSHGICPECLKKAEA